MVQKINGKAFVRVIDEGFEDSWIEQVKKLGLLPSWPVYLRETDDPAIVIASNHLLTDQEFEQVWRR